VRLLLCLQMLSSFLYPDKVKAAGESISAYDADLNVTLWNPAIEKRSGISEKDALGKSLFFLFPHIKDDQRAKFLSLAMVMDQTFFFPNMIYLYIQPFTYYTQYIHPLKINGKVVGVINIVRDHAAEENYSQNEFLQFFDNVQVNSFSPLQHDEDSTYL
jgi:PAS domain-containing protein